MDFNLAPPNLVCYPAGLVWIERFALPLKCEKHRISLIFSVLTCPSSEGCGAGWLFALAALPFLASCGGGGDTTEVFLNEIRNSKIVPVMVVDNDYKIGYVDDHGKLVIPAKFGFASYFHEGLALIGDTAKMIGYIKSDGSYAIEPKYAEGTDFSNGLAWVAEPDSSLKVIDTKGNVKFRFPKAYTASAFVTSVAPYKTIDGKSGLVTDKGQEITLTDEYKDFNDIYDNKVLGETTDGRTVIGKIKDGTLEPIDIPGNPNIKEANLKKELVIISVDGKRGLMNFKGEYIINPRYKNMSFDGEDLLIFENDKEKFGWLNLKGDEVIPAKYKAVGAFFNNSEYAIVSTSKSKFQTINRKGETIIKPKYEKIQRTFQNPDTYIIENDNLFGLITPDGKVLCEPQFSKIRFSSKYVTLASSGDNWGVINNAGQYQGTTNYDLLRISALVNATSQYVSAADIVTAVMDLRNKANFNISWPDLASEFSFTKYDTGFNTNTATLKKVKLPGTTISMEVALNDYTLTRARSKSNAKLNPNARPYNFFFTITLSSATKRDEVFAALEKATGFESEVGDIEEMSQYQDVVPNTINMYISPGLNFISTAK